MKLDKWKLRAAMAKAYMTQADLAKSSGLSPMSISKYVRGSGISRVNLQKIARALHVKPKDLLPDGEKFIYRLDKWKFREALAKAHMTQTDLATSLGVTPQMINSYVNGVIVGAVNLKKITAALDVKPEEILEAE